MNYGGKCINDGILAFVAVITSDFKLGVEGYCEMKRID